MSITVKELSNGLEQVKKVAAEKKASQKTTVLLERNGGIEEKIDITVNPPNISDTFSLDFGSRQIEHSFIGDVEDDLLKMGFA